LAVTITVSALIGVAIWAWAARVETTARTDADAQRRDARDLRIIPDVNE
jgi:hypothetical protein